MANAIQTILLTLILTCLIVQVLSNASSNKKDIRGQFLKQFSNCTIRFVGNFNIDTETERFQEYFDFFKKRLTLIAVQNLRNVSDGSLQQTNTIYGRKYSESCIKWNLIA